MSEKSRSRDALRTGGKAVTAALATAALFGTAAEAATAANARPNTGGTAAPELLAPLTAEAKNKKLAPEQMVHRLTSRLAGNILKQYRKQTQTGRSDAYMQILDQDEAGKNVELTSHKVVPHGAHLGVWDVSAMMQRRNGKLVPSTTSHLSILYTEFPDKGGNDGPSPDDSGITTYSLIIGKSPDGPDKDNHSEWHIQNGMVSHIGAGGHEVMYTGDSSFNTGGFQHISLVASDIASLQDAGEALHTGHSQK